MWPLILQWVDDALITDESQFTRVQCHGTRLMDIVFRISYFSNWRAQDDDNTNSQSNLSLLRILSPLPHLSSRRPHYIIAPMMSILFRTLFSVI
jgi:hypothetical protein